jgi:hypothetical protein
MRFGRRHEQASLAMLAAMDVHHRAVLARHEETERAVFEALTALRGELARRETALADTFACVISTCGKLAEWVEDDRAERNRLASAVDGLSRTLSHLVPDPSPRHAVVDAVEDVIDVLDVHDEAIAVTPHHIVEVHCRFGDRWVDGFEVCESIADNEGVRYRLRRRSDGSVLPTVFAAAEVREVRDRRHDDIDAQRRRWSVMRP